MTERIAYDAYLTPDALALACCKRLAQAVNPLLVVEPSAGEGAFVRAVKEVWPKAFISVNEIRLECIDKLHAAGATEVTNSDWLNWREARTFSKKQLDLIVGNLPYNVAVEHIKHSFEVSNNGTVIAFLLRMAFLGSQDRARDFWPHYPLHSVHPIAERPSFTPDGKTESSEYGFFVWSKGSSKSEHPRIYPHIWWK